MDIGYRYRLVAEGTKCVADVCVSDGLLTNEVGDHVLGRLEERANVAKFGMLAAKMIAHVHMASGGLVRRMERHSNSPFVVAEKSCGRGLAKTKVPEKHTEIESFLGVK